VPLPQADDPGASSAYAPTQPKPAQPRTPTSPPPPPPGQSPPAPAPTAKPADQTERVAVNPWSTVHWNDWLSADNIWSEDQGARHPVTRPPHPPDGRPPSATSAARQHPVQPRDASAPASEGLVAARMQSSTRTTRLPPMAAARPSAPVSRGAKTVGRPMRAPLRPPVRQLTAIRSSQASHSRAISPDAKVAAKLTRQGLTDPVIRKRALDIYLALVVLGFTPLQAAAFLGNFFEESNYTLSPTTVQQDHGPGRGFAQWDITQKSQIGRWEFENRFAKQEGFKNPRSFDAELGFLIAEVTDLLPPIDGHHDNYYQLHHQLSPSSRHHDLAHITQQVADWYEQPDPSREHLDRRIAAADVINTTFRGQGRAVTDMPAPLKAYLARRLVLTLARGEEKAIVPQILPYVPYVRKK